VTCNTTLCKYLGSEIGAIKVVIIFHVPEKTPLPCVDFVIL
jgi:hypothetical protein